VKIIKKLVGDEFCSERRADDLTNRFAISGLWEKKVYIEPDLDTRQPLPESFIKAYVGEQITTIEEKMQKPMDGVKMSLAMFFVSNYQFHVKGIDGIERRLVLIPFENEIKNHDTRLLKKIIGECPHGIESPGHDGEVFDERPGLIALALQGWDAYRDNDFIIKMPEWIIRRKEAWVKEANSVARFIQETIVDPNTTTPIPRDDMYSSYTGWCRGEGMKELGKKNFAEEVRKDGRIREFKQGKTYFQFMGNDTSDVPF
jgi:phage/plasmid-associated DNA primase